MFAIRTLAPTKEKWASLTWREPARRSNRYLSGSARLAFAVCFYPPGFAVTPV